MELFRFVAIEWPSASSVEKVLQIKLEDDLKHSKLASDLLDPKTREQKLKGIGKSSYSFPARLSGILISLDSFTQWVRASLKVPTPADAGARLKSVFGDDAAALLHVPDFIAAQSRLAEQYLIDRLAPQKRPKAEQIKTRTRLQCIGLIEILAEGGSQAERALRIPFCIAIQVDPKLFRNGAASGGGSKSPGASAGKPPKELTPPELARAELDLKRAYGAKISNEIEKNDDDFDLLEQSVSAEMKKNGDDFDSLKRSTSASARLSGKQPPSSLADLVLSIHADPLIFQRIQASLSPSTRRVIGQLGLGKNASLDEALEVLSQKQKQARRNGAVPQQFRSFGGRGGLIWNSYGKPPPDGAPTYVAPTDGAPDTVGSARVLGYGNLKRVVDEVIGYKTAQLSEVYNIPMGSTKERELRMIERTEESSANLSSKVTEQETETESEERFSLASESRKLSVFDAQARAGGAFSASYGAVSVEGSAEASVGFRSESAEELSTDYSKNVVSRAATKITERVEEMRRRASFRERLSAEKEAYTNTSAAHITGIYQWINEVHQGKLLQYSERLMLEVIVPKPGANLLWAANAVPPDPMLPQPPPEFDVLLDDPDSLDDPDLLTRAISRDTYMKLAAKYAAADVPAPPEAEKILMKGIVAGDQAVRGTFATIVKTEESLRVPDSYVATRGWIRLVASRGTAPGSSWYRVMIGTSQYNFGADSRTFVRDLLITDDQGNFKGSVPISVIGREDRAAVVHVELICTPTTETIEAWRSEVYAQLLLAYKRALQDYQDATGSAFAAPASRNPEQLRRMERDEIKRSSLTIITGQHFEQFNALPANQPANAPPAITLSEVKPEGSWIQFFENAVEWENSDFVLYPYFWSDRADWARAMTMRLDDAKHEEFLRAGAARVLVPVRRGFEAAVMHYLESASGSPVLWDGLDPDLIMIDSPMYLAVWQEIKERQGQLDEEPKEIKTWRFEVPTNHRILRADGVLPAPPPEVTP